MHELVIVADDRTGALEVAGECAALDAIAVTVVPYGVDVPRDARRVVIDLGSRHLTPTDAATRAAEVGVRPAGRRAHKIDSGLRGNWAAEVVARLAAGDGPAVVVAALPAVGRVCHGGVVGVASADGSVEPIAEALAADGRGGPWSSRPADHLRRAELDDVPTAPSVTALTSWLPTAAADAAIVCDAATADDLRALGQVVRASGALLAGTAAAVAAWHGGDATPRSTSPSGLASVLVVCGSLDPGARRQVDVLAATEVPGLTVVTSREPLERPVPGAAAEATAAWLAGEAWRTIERARPDAVVVVGGDTTAAVLVDDPVIVVGRVEAGAALSRRADGSGPWFVTRSGSFGDDGALRDLVAALVS